MAASKAELTKRGQPWLRALTMPLVYTALVMLIFWRLWTPIDGAKSTWKYDPPNEYWGDLEFQLDTLSRGELALWNSNDRAGFPLYGDPQPGMLYPPNWPLLVSGAVAGDMPYWFAELKCIAHWIFGAIGMHLFLRRRRMAEQACYVGGTLFAYTAPAIRYGGSALNWTFAWLPWALLATDWFAEAPSRKRAIVLGTVLAMTLLSGAPALFVHMLVFAVPYGLVVMWGRIRASWMAIAVAAGVFLLWVLPLVASNLELLPETVRAKRDLAFLTHTIQSPAHMLNVVLPRWPGGEYNFYGLFSLVSFATLIATRADKRGLVLFGIMVFGLLLALGKYTDFLPATGSTIPVFRLFRRAHNYLYITSAAVAAGAGLGLGYLLSLNDGETRRALARKITIALSAAAFALGMALLVSLVVSDDHLHPKNESLGLAFASALGALWLLRAILVTSGRKKAIYAWIAVVFVVLDIWTAVAPSIKPGFAAKPKPTHDALIAKLEGVPSEARIYDRNFLKYRPGVRLGVRDLGGYEGDPLRLVRYDEFMKTVQRAPRVMGHANVRYYLDGNKQPPLHPKPVDKMTAIQKSVYELEHVAPRVMYVPNPTIVADRAAAMKALPAIVPGTGAVLEGPAPPPAADTATVVAGTITSESANALTVEITTPGPGVVVVAEAYFPAWTATVNGETAVIHPANGMFRGFVVPAAGTYRIEMKLRPFRFYALLPGYFAAFGLFMWFVIGRVRLRIRARRTGD